MDKIVINGGKRISGAVKVSAAKNAVLPIIAASLLCSEQCLLENIPLLDDVIVICDVLNSMGASIEIDKKNQRIITKNNMVNGTEPPEELVRKMRASFLVMGPILARFGRIRISLPGGCNIGTRPINLHLKGLAALGADIVMGHGYVEAVCKRLKGNRVYLDFPSVGATENIMMSAVLAEGETIVEHCAKEPEIVDLAVFLNSMGARISGAGTDTIRIEGVKELRGTKHSIVPDRVEAGTYMIAGAMTSGDVTVENIIPQHVRPVTAKLQEAGVEVIEGHDSVRVIAKQRPRSVDIMTLPYPGFPTDMQSQFMSLMSIASGTSIINETVFENRYMHAAELKRMGANIKIDGNIAVVEGVPILTGAKVKATDLRAGAALVLSGIAAEGRTEIYDIHHIDRGYVDIVGKMKGLGVRIERVSE
jgi:UDP-N-acetylglucosamine 1-carboxyvinyltransferase